MFDFDLFKSSFDSHLLVVSERMDVVLEGQTNDAYEELYIGTVFENTVYARFTGIFRHPNIFRYIEIFR